MRQVVFQQAAAYSAESSVDGKKSDKNSPVEVGRLSNHYLPFFFAHPNGGWPWDFGSINSSLSLVLFMS